MAIPCPVPLAHLQSPWRRTLNPEGDQYGLESGPGFRRRGYEQDPAFRETRHGGFHYGENRQCGGGTTAAGPQKRLVLPAVLAHNQR